MSLLPYKVTALARVDNGELNIIPNASVTVLTSSGMYAQLYEADETTPIGNPFNCDDNGERQIYLSGGSYSISVAGGQSWEIRLSGASDIQSVATIADLRNITGLQNGQKISIVEYASGTRRGGGMATVIDSADADDGVITFVTADGKRVRRDDVIITPELGGCVGNGTTDDRVAFKRCTDFINSAGGGKLVGRGRGAIYKLLSSTDVFDPLVPFFPMSGVSGVEIDLNGSRLFFDNEIDQEYFTLFQFTDSENIEVHNGQVVARVGKFNEVDGQTYGPIILEVLGETVNVSMHDFVGAGWNRGFNAARTAAQISGSIYPDFDEQARNIEIYNIKGDDISYGIGCQFNGSHLKAWNCEFTNVHRAYFVYGVTNHDVDIYAKNWDASCCRLWSLLGRALQNITLKIRAEADDGPAATQCVQMEFNGSFNGMAGLFKNIDITADIDLGGVVQQGFAIINDGDPADMGSGRHTIDGLTLRGNISNTNLRAVTYITKDGDVLNISTQNMRFEDLTISNQGSASVFIFGHTQTDAYLRNVRAFGTLSNINVSALATNFTGTVYMDEVRTPGTIGDSDAAFTAKGVYTNCNAQGTSSATMTLINKLVFNSVIGSISTSLPINRPHLKYVPTDPTVVSRPIIGYRRVDSPAAAASVTVTLANGTHMYAGQLASSLDAPRTYRMIVGCQSGTDAGQFACNLSLRISGGAITNAAVTDVSAVAEVGAGISAGHLSVGVSSGSLTVTLNSGAGAIYDIVSVAIFD